MTTDKNVVDLEKLSNSLKVIEDTNNSINNMKLSNIVLDIDTELSKVNFEHGNCLNDYRDTLDSLVAEIDKLKMNINELSKGLEKTINSFSDVEETNFRRTDLSTDVSQILADEKTVTKIPEPTTEAELTQESTSQGSINTVPIGLGIGAAGIAGSVGMVAADSLGLLKGKEDPIPNYRESAESVEYVEKIDKKEDKNDEFIAHSEKFDDVTPYHASRDKDVIDKFYDDEEN